jgi:hypothetical protein
MFGYAKHYPCDPFIYNASHSFRTRRHGLALLFEPNLVDTT